MKNLKILKIFISKVKIKIFNNKNNKNFIYRTINKLKAKEIDFLLH
jgi:hypothetical protein